MKHKLRHTEEDQTSEVRKVISENDNIEFEGEAITHGMLPEDLEKEYGGYGKIGNIGMGKILPLYSRNNVKLKGGKFTNPKHAFPHPNPIIGTRRHHTVSELSFLHLEDCNNIHLEGIEYQGPHFYEEDGMPFFVGSYEFAHGVEIAGSHNVFLKDLDFSNVPGDMVYFRAGKRVNRNITILDCTIDFNGRQGVAWGTGENIYIDNLKVIKSGRGGADFEPPKHGYFAKNVIIRNSYFRTNLLPVPMGGLGVCENILIENNEFKSSSPNTSIYADRVNSFRKNIIFRNNTRIGSYGSSSTACYNLMGCENVLIEGETAELQEGRTGRIISLDNCKNVVIRNNDFSFRDGNTTEKLKIVLRDTPSEEVKVYGNSQDIIFEILEFELPFKPAPNLADFAHYGREDWGYWLKARSEWQQYVKDRSKTASTRYIEVEQYDVEKHGEPDVPKDPDFIPYMGIVEPAPEPVEPDPVPEPEKPTDPTPEPEEPQEPETTEPPVEQPEKPKEWYENKLLWVIGGIVLVIILALAL